MSNKKLKETEKIVIIAQFDKNLIIYEKLEELDLYSRNSHGPMALLGRALMVHIWVLF